MFDLGKSSSEKTKELQKVESVSKNSFDFVLVCRFEARSIRKLQIQQVVRSKSRRLQNAIPTIHSTSQFNTFTFLAQYTNLRASSHLDPSNTALTFQF